VSDRISRRELLRRGAAGGALISVPGLLAACGGSSKSSASSTTTAGTSQALPKTITWSNWPLYIDVDEKTKSHPTLVAFEKKYGVKVKYLEDVNDNDTFFGKIEGPLSQGQSIGRDIVVLTDYSGLPARMVELGWVEKLDKSALPNIKNLVPTQQHPSWDKDREYSLPWQSGFTGIGYDPAKVGGDITSVEQLLTDPKLKGKVTLLNQMPDTVGLVLLANGDDPSKVTKQAYDKAVSMIKKAVDSGQVRQFTGNDYAPLLAKGDVWAAVAWSGDLVQLKADHPGLKWALPKAGGIVWTDNMLVPKGGNAHAASVLMNWYYQPSVMAKVEDYVNYVPPVSGTEAALKKIDPAVAKNPLIIPPQSVLDNAHQFDPAAVNNQDFRKKFQALMG
jgi:spermidine/putrescine transport system substrate-binding protein